MSRQLSFTDYEGFVEKFKPKKTTDDCYTPPAVIPYRPMTDRNHPFKGGFFLVT